MVNFEIERAVLPVWKGTCSRKGAKGMPVTHDVVKDLARECGFELAGVAAAAPAPEITYFREWVRQGMAGEMAYLTDRRADVRSDPAFLLPSVRSVICVGKLYNAPRPHSTESPHGESAWISRYAWGEDYHRVLRQGLARLVRKLQQHTSAPFEWKACVDTAPLLERAYARRAGLGWIARNTCLINQQLGSWFFLGELLTSLEIEPDTPPPDRCGSCTRCVDACPTKAILPTHRPEGPAYALDARRCISYFTVELRGSVPEMFRRPSGNHVFGCDICQDVCPWNRNAPATNDPAFAPRHFAPPLERLAALSEQEFREVFLATPVTRAKYAGFLRSVAIAMGNAGLPKFCIPLMRLAALPDPAVAEHARWALERIE